MAGFADFSCKQWQLSEVGMMNSPIYSPLKALPLLSITLKNIIIQIIIKQVEFNWNSLALCFNQKDVNDFEKNSSKFKNISVSR